MRATTLPSLSSLLAIPIFLFVLVAARPPPTHPPNCPYSTDLAGHGRVFLRCFYQPSLATQPGGYREFTKGFFWNDFTITDLTPNYPGPNGEKLPVIGTYANSRIRFADLLQKYIPKFYEIFGNVQLDGSLPSYGGRQDDNCLGYDWESHYTATLLKPYG